jgi:hypothetical protein
MRTGVTIALLIALCVLSGPLGSTVPVATAQSSSSTLDEPTTTIVIQIHSNGDARISVVTKVPINGENGTVGFEQAAKAFEVGSIYEEPLNVFNRAVRRANNASNRSMSIVDVTRNASRDEGVGQFVIEFTWKNFAVVAEDGRYIRVGDAFNTTQGTWLPGLSAGETLVIKAPPGYFVSSSPIPLERAQVFKWTGPESFEPGFLLITYVRGRSPESRISPQNPPPTASQGNPVSSFSLVVGAVVLIALGSLGVVVFLRRDRVLTKATTDGGIGTKRIENANVPLLESDFDQDTDSDSNTDIHPDSDTDTDSDADSDTDTGSPDDGIDLSLLSDEERVERLLRQNGGRMKQANIVSEMDWSDAKVSQLLSAMDGSGRIEKLRIGRENLISLSEYDPDSNS